jgi:hypothetical protein
MPRVGTVAKRSPSRRVCMILGVNPMLFSVIFIGTLYFFMRAIPAVFFFPALDARSNHVIRDLEPAGMRPVRLVVPALSLAPRTCQVPWPVREFT